MDARDTVTIAGLKARAEQLHGRADRLVRVGDQLLYGVLPEVAKAFVWAAHRRADPAVALAKTIYGPGQLGPAAEAHVQALVKHLTACSRAFEAGRAA